jgi:hypothetical protein
MIPNRPVTSRLDRMYAMPSLNSRSAATGFSDGTNFGSFTATRHPMTAM